MLRRIAMLVLAGGVGLAGLSGAPARADDDTAQAIVGIILGATALAIIADAVDDDRRHYRPRQYYRPHPRPVYRPYVRPRVYVAPRAVVRPRHVRPRYVHPRYVQPRYVAPRHVRPRHVRPRYVAPRYATPRPVYRPRAVNPRRIARDYNPRLRPAAPARRDRPSRVDRPRDRFEGR
ncbi:MAG: hypothetical protein AAFR46_13120 [Pseudomonadota bacterium]